MIRISVVSNIEQALSKMQGFESKQLRFAAMKTVTNVATEIRDEVRAQMPKRFTLRRSWVQKGVRSTPANMSKLTALVGSVDPFMKPQELGGVKVGKPGGGNFSSSSLPGRSSRNRLAIPTENVLRTKSDIIRKSDLPKQLGERGFQIKSKSGVTLLAKRFAKGKRAGIQVLYKLVRRATIKKRLGLKEIGEQVIKDRFETIFTNNLLAAQNSPKQGNNPTP